MTMKQTMVYLVDHSHHNKQLVLTIIINLHKQYNVKCTL